MKLPNGLRASRTVLHSLVALSATLLGGCSDALPTPPVAPQYAHLVGASDTLAVKRLAAGLVRQGIRDFDSMSDSILWQFINASDGLVSIGVKNPGSQRGFDRGRRVLSDATWTGAVATIRGVRGVTIISVDSLIPTVRAKLGDFATFQMLRTKPFVSYLEPGRQVDMEFLGGCGEDAASGPYSYTASGDILPATFIKMNVDRAWKYANGAGVLIGLVDTGVDGYQQELNANFASGLSTNRTITHSNGPSDHCGHGTKLAGVIAAPMNGSSVVGVAWGASLISFRHGDGVVADAWAAANGIDAAGAAGAKVIEMAFGTGFRYADLADRITYWYYNHDVVFVGAAWTWSFLDCSLTNSNNVAFPAEKAEVIAVSPANHDGGKPCTAGYGPDLDVIAFHRQPTTGRVAHAGPVEVAESSNSSAIVAGVAAMVRQRFPGLDRTGVRARIISTAGTACGAPPSWHLMLNAEAAVGGLCWRDRNYNAYQSREIRFTDDHPDPVTMSFSVDVTSESGPISYQWPGNSSTGPSATYTFSNPGFNYTQVLSVRVRDSWPTSSPLLIPFTVELYDETCKEYFCPEA